MFVRSVLSSYSKLLAGVSLALAGQAALTRDRGQAPAAARQDAQERLDCPGADRRGRGRHDVR